MKATLTQVISIAEEGKEIGKTGIYYGEMEENKHVFIGTNFRNAEGVKGLTIFRKELNDRTEKLFHTDPKNNYIGLGEDLKRLFNEGEFFWKGTNEFNYYIKYCEGVKV